MPATEGIVSCAMKAGLRSRARNTKQEEKTLPVEEALIVSFGVNTYYMYRSGRGRLSHAREVTFEFHLSSFSYKIELKCLLTYWQEENPVQGGVAP